ncbi:MAG: hypothetical protein J7578_04920, partial [Chitinophagaceae bacterium]|nr:hypothetical protein [Chitinophagaceae bacterium]
ICVMPFYSTSDRDTGKLSVQFPEFVPSTSLVGPPGATHFRIITSAAELDFEKNKYMLNESRTPSLLYDDAESAGFTLDISITPNTKQAFIHLLGVEFYQEVNGKMYLLHDSSFVPLGVIHAESAVA